MEVHGISTNIQVHKWLGLYLALGVPGIIVMVADNDAGGITTYAAIGAKFGFNLIWFLILFGPVMNLCWRL